MAERWVQAHGVLVAQGRFAIAGAKCAILPTMTSDKSWEVFWPLYVREHSKKATRWMHFVGTSGAIGKVPRER